MKEDDNLVLKDLAGWSPVMGHTTPLGSDYEIYISPDRTQLAGVHMDDGEVSIIVERKTSKILYLHPKTRRGMRRFGLTEPEFQELIKKYGVDVTKI